MFKACIFDLDGTLANTLTTLAHFVNRALTKCGYRNLPEERFRFLVGNGADRLMRDSLAEVCGSFTEEQVRDLRRAYDEGYDNAPLYLTEPYDGIISALKTLKEHGIKLAVLSNKPHYLTVQVVEKLFPDTFDVCYGQRAEVPRKPVPDGALMIAEELGISPCDCLYLGDTGVDMNTGNAAGMTTVGVCWGFRPREELEEHKAAHLITHPSEILDLVSGTANRSHR
ncbi:MAG: HAD family hydrolase [Ruminococcaceae bacterium]|nr:HAD family hydrolase [Oscillospiraceae bacterium]